MKEKYVSRISLIINALIFIGVGITLMLIPTTSANIFHIVVSLLISLLGFISFIFNAIRTRKRINILISISTFAIGVFFFSKPLSFLILFPIIFGFYMIINGIIKFVTYIIYKEQKLKGYHPTLIASIIDFIFGCIMMLHPSQNIKLLTIILGVYLILFGVTYLYDFLKDAFPKLFSVKKRRIRLTLPIFISALIPYQVHSKLNKVLNKYMTNVHINNKNASGEIDLEIYIHVKNLLFGRFGHADLCFENKVYSYGCYDDNSKRLFESLGDGVFFTIEDKNKYLKFCTSYSSKTIFAYGLTLSSIQKNKIKQELQKIQNDTYPWKCQQELNKESIYNDYASTLFRYTDAKFYKFSNGKWKKYFLFSTNCVKLVDKVLGATGSDVLKINGIITPGAYYDYLNNEFKRQNSGVIKKKIYTDTKK